MSSIEFFGIFFFIFRFLIHNVFKFLLRFDINTLFLHFVRLFETFNRRQVWFLLFFDESIIFYLSISHLMLCLKHLLTFIGLIRFIWSTLMLIRLFHTLYFQNIIIFPSFVTCFFREDILKGSHIMRDKIEMKND